MAVRCKKCNDTGTSRWGGFYEHRGPSQTCTACPRAAELEAMARAVPGSGLAAKQAARKAARAARN